MSRVDFFKKFFKEKYWEWNLEPEPRALCVRGKCFPPSYIFCPLLTSSLDTESILYFRWALNLQSSNLSLLSSCDCKTMPWGSVLTTVVFTSWEWERDPWGWKGTKKSSGRWIWSKCITPYQSEMQCHVELIHSNKKRLKEIIFSFRLKYHCSLKNKERMRIARGVAWRTKALAAVPNGLSTLDP